MHVCLDDTALCKSLLATLEVDVEQLQMAMLALGMPHNLTAWACMGRLCEVAQPLIEPGTQKFMTAATTHFDGVLYCLRNAMEVSQLECHARIVADVRKEAVWALLKP